MSGVCFLLPFLSLQDQNDFAKDVTFRGTSKTFLAFSFECTVFSADTLLMSCI